MHVLAAAERVDERLVLREVGQDAQLDLAVVGREDQVPRLGHERLADAAPSAVRMGMFCRLGSDDESRPVAATVCWNEAWMRPVSG